jgi:hypothetical protein
VRLFQAYRSGIFVFNLVCWQRAASTEQVFAQSEKEFFEWNLKILNQLQVQPTAKSA